MVRYYGLYANAHRGKVKKALIPSTLRMAEQDIRCLPSKGWAALIRKPHIGLRSAAMIRKVYFEQVALMAAASACTHGDVLAAP